MRTSQVLEDAAKLLEQRAWLQGNGTGTDFDGSQGFCTQTAIGACSGTVSAQINAYRAVANAIDMERAKRLSATQCAHLIWEWNDTPGRTRWEVIALLLSVAATCKASEPLDAEPETPRPPTFVMWDLFGSGLPTDLAFKSTSTPVLKGECTMTITGLNLENLDKLKLVELEETV